jgi:hypothetical protein
MFSTQQPLPFHIGQPTIATPSRNDLRLPYSTPDKRYGLARGGRRAFLIPRRSVRIRSAAGTTARYDCRPLS